MSQTIRTRPTVIRQGTVRRQYPYISVDLWDCPFNFTPRGLAVWAAFTDAYWWGLLREAKKIGKRSKIGAYAAPGRGQAGYFQVRPKDIPAIVSLLERVLDQGWATEPAG